MIEIILTILFVSVLAWICALFSYLLDYCFWTGSIFGKYIPYLAKTLVKALNPKDYKEVSMLKKELQEVEFIGRAEKIFFFKILGGCVICTNVWIAMISFVFINLYFNIGWLYMLPYVFSASFFLRKITKI